MVAQRGNWCWTIFPLALSYNSPRMRPISCTLVVYAVLYHTPCNRSIQRPSQRFHSKHGAFNLHMSNDGGATWHDVPNLPQSFFALSWFAGADGKIYTYSTNNLPGGSSSSGNPAGQATAIVATVSSRQASCSSAEYCSSSTSFVCECRSIIAGVCKRHCAHVRQSKSNDRTL